MSTRQTVLDFIAAFRAEHHYGPSVREVCEAANLGSPATGAYYLERLRYEGLIDWERGKPRTLHLVYDWREHHGLLFDLNRRIVGCRCGFVASESDSGYGNSVVAHIVEVSRV